MKKLIFLIAFFSAIVLFTSCSEDNSNDGKNNIVDVEKTQLLFFTNAQFLVNCGMFDVEIYIDSVYKGKIEMPYYGSSEPDCIQTESTLLVELENNKQSKIKYIAKGLGCNMVLEEEVIIEPNVCNKIFIDFAKEEE
jgi:hypothetical protein